MSEFATLLSFQDVLSFAEWGVLGRLLDPQRRRGILADWSSRELADVLKASRRTVQRALDRLNELGLIHSTPGAGRVPDQHSLDFLVVAAATPEADPELARPEVSHAGRGANLSLRGAKIAPQVRGANLSPVPAKPTPNAGLPTHAYRERARGFTHSLQTRLLKEKPKTDRVSECRAEIAARFNAVFPWWQLPASDFVFREFESLGADLGMSPDDWGRWFESKRREKQAKRYPIESAGALLRFARTDVAPWWYGQYRKPPRRAEARAEASPPAKTAAELRDDIETLQAFLAEERPTYPDYYRERLREARAELGALERGGAQEATG